jgi:dipeptidyl aminopeptidase/acylaminoacyl peptidase
MFRKTKVAKCAGRTQGVGRDALTGVALLGLIIIALACGGGEEKNQSTPTQKRSPAPLPTVTLPALPPGSAEQTGLLIYVDPIARQTIALNLSNGGRRVVPGIVPPAGASITGDCTSDGRLIAYSTTAANQQVGVVTFVGEGAPGQSVEVKGAIQEMAWSPGGDRLAVTIAGDSGTHLELLDPQTGATTALPAAKGVPGSARWAPDGQRLAVDFNNNGISDIYVLDVATSTISKVSSRPSALTPDWSPDGRTIVYSAGDDRGGLPQIYAVDADGKNERKLTATASDKLSPRWSRDGSLIAFAGAVAVPLASNLPARAHNQAIWVARADGTNEVPVTDINLDAVPLAWCLQGSWLQ